MFCMADKLAPPHVIAIHSTSVVLSLPAASVDGSVEPSADNYFSSTEHANTLLFCIQGLRERQDLCDVTLCAENKDFLVHKVILAASSRYFHAMFTNNHRESVENTIHLNGIDAPTLELLLNFIYSSSL